MELRVVVVKIIKYILAQCLAALPVSSRYIGPPKGTHIKALDALSGIGKNFGKIVTERKPIMYVQPPAKSVEKKAVFFQGRRVYMHPYAATFNGARIFGKEGAAILPDDCLALDTLPAFYVARTRFDPGGLRVMRKFKMPRLHRLDGRIINLALGETQNYSHWTFQNMTRLQLLQAAEIKADYYYIDVSQDFQRDYLKIMGIPIEKVIPVDRRAHIEASELTVVGGCSFNQVPYPDLLNEVRQKVLGNSSVLASRRIYISREDASYRKVYNEDEVMAYLETFGFERVIMSGRAVRDQARLLQQAAVVVGPHGANMTNVIFCQPGTYVLEVFQPEWVDSGFTAASAQVGLRYYYGLGEETKFKEGSSTHPGMAPGFRFKLDRLERFMKIIENGT